MNERWLIAPRKLPRREKTDQEISPGLYPHSRNVATNVAKKFLDLVKKHFPPGGKFRKLFNKNNVKVSYSCMPNISRVIKSHNSKILNDTKTVTPHCNCRGEERKKNCPLPGYCRIENVILLKYQLALKAKALINICSVT